jgi:hypothetical protein
MRWPSDWGENQNVIEGDETYGTGRHAVNIIGWEDNYIDDRGQEHGNVWIIQNSHYNRQIFRLKIGNVVNPYLYVYIGEITIEGYDNFVADITKNWHEGMSETISKKSNAGDYVSHNIVKSLGNFKVIRNPKDIFSDVPGISAVQVGILSGVDLYEVDLR